MRSSEVMNTSADNGARETSLVFFARCSGASDGLCPLSSYRTIHIGGPLDEGCVRTNEEFVGRRVQCCEEQRQRILAALRYAE